MNNVLNWKDCCIKVICLPVPIPERVSCLLSDRSRARRTDKEVAEAVMCSQKTVANVRRRFLAGGLQSALHDKGGLAGWENSPARWKQN